MPTLESKLIIGATDDTAAAFASVMAKIDALQAKVATVQASTAAVKSLGAATNIMRQGGQHTLMDLIGDIRGRPTYSESFPTSTGMPMGVAHIPMGRDPRSPSTGTQAYLPPQTPLQEVSVSGEARVDHEITLRVEPSPLLTAIVEQARNAIEFTVPLIGGGTGRMDSHAAAHRAGGIGAM